MVSIASAKVVGIGEKTVRVTREEEGRGNFFLPAGGISAEFLETVVSS